MAESVKMISLINNDNIAIMQEHISKGLLYDMIYADCIYQSFDFSWLPYCQQLLKDTGSIFVQTDQTSVCELKLHMDKLFGKKNFINWIIVGYNWGGRPKRAFGRKHDDILFYGKTDLYKFYPERVQIDKATAGTSFDKKGTGKQTPTDVWPTLGHMHTMSKERVRGLRWQKPQVLIERLILATTDEGDDILDPFMGGGVVGIVSKKLNRNYTGIELDKNIYNIAKSRI